jgi:hypothetical protein
MRRMARRIVPVIALCALGASAAACTTAGKGSSGARVQHKVPVIASRNTTRAAAAPPAPASGVDLHSASAVALAEVEATWTLNTVVDAGWYAGELAATAYMTPRYAALMRKEPPLGSPGATWTAWAAHRATTSVTASTEADPGAPSDTALTAYRKVIVTVTPHGTAALSGTGPLDTAMPIDAATPNRAATPDDPATTDETGRPEGAGEWVGQPEVWVSYLVLSRGTRGAAWRVAQSETTS